MFTARKHLQHFPLLALVISTLLFTNTLFTGEDISFSKTCVIQHLYEYDADNRITNVYTSKYPQANAIINSRVVEGNQLWEQDAKYFYYAHGPLARTEIGNDKSQGMDYAYTLQGWIKGVNSNTLDKSRDIGQDGLTASINSGTAKDAFGYTLNYHANDYNAIQGLRWNTATDRFVAVTVGSDLKASGNDLFNGNITSMVTTIEQPMVYTSALNQAPNVLPQGTAYKYDQLNRLKEMKAYSNLNIPTNIWQSGSTYAGMYNNKFNFDANGNITYQERADGSGLIFDKMNYKYKVDGNGKTIQNRLYHVNDLGLATTAIDDIDDQGTFNSNPLTTNDGVTNNYQYDEIGNLKKDKQEQILRIDWTVYGKIKSIIRTSTSSKSDLEFNYDASGNRISKIEKPHGSSIENGGANNTGLWTTTYYTRDAQGNIMTTYKFALPSGTASFKLIERNLFGSSRLGTDNTEVELVGVLPTANPFIRTLGNKHYEGSNHLGNVLVVFTDKKMPVTANGTTIDHFDGDVENTFDYTPFGAPMNERSYRLVMKKGPTYSTNPNDKFPAFVNGNEPLANIASENPKYRYGFNGKENDNEVKGNGNQQDYGMRIYDPRLGRFLSVDPLSGNYPWYTPYQFAGNNPIWATDLDGLEEDVKTGQQPANIPVPSRMDYEKIKILADKKQEIVHAMAVEFTEMPAGYNSFQQAKLYSDVEKAFSPMVTVDADFKEIKVNGPDQRGPVANPTGTAVIATQFKVTINLAPQNSQENNSKISKDAKSAAVKAGGLLYKIISNTPVTPVGVGLETAKLVLNGTPAGIGSTSAERDGPRGKNSVPVFNALQKMKTFFNNKIENKEPTTVSRPLQN